MWIRSQDERKLIDANSIYVFKNPVTNKAEIRTAEFTLGEYATEEKAIKVLNSLEEVITKREDDIRYRPNAYSSPVSRQWEELVFQMPDDD